MRAWDVLSDPPPHFGPFIPRPTMKDVADRAGVSRQLVSMVLRNKLGPSAAARDRIMTAAHELGYHPDLSARLLSQRRSYQIGVIYTMHQPFEVDLVECLFLAAASAGYSLVLVPLFPGRTQMTADAELMQQRIDALIVLATDDGLATVSELSLQLPTVQLTGPVTHLRADDVRVDNRQGMRLALDHLADLGHRHICHVDGGTGPNAAERRESYAERMRELGFGPEIDVVTCAYTEEDGAQAARTLLTRDSLPSAVLCGNDRSALGLIETMVRAGLRIPEDMSVVGYDDSNIASLSFLSLTTIRHDPRRLAELAVAAVVDRLDSHSQLPPTQIRVAAQLVVRNTTAPPRS